MAGDRRGPSSKLEELIDSLTGGDPNADPLQHGWDEVVASATEDERDLGGDYRDQTSGTPVVRERREIGVEQKVQIPNRTRNPSRVRTTMRAQRSPAPPPSMEEELRLLNLELAEELAVVEEAVPDFDDEVTPPSGSIALNRASNPWALSSDSSSSLVAEVQPPRSEPILPEPPADSPPEDPYGVPSPSSSRPFGLPWEPSAEEQHSSHELNVADESSPWSREAPAMMDGNDLPSSLAPDECKTESLAPQSRDSGVWDEGLPIKSVLPWKTVASLGLAAGVVLGVWALLYWGPEDSPGGGTPAAPPLAESAAPTTDAIDKTAAERDESAAPKVVDARPVPSEELATSAEVTVVEPPPVQHVAPTRSPSKTVTPRRESESGGDHKQPSSEPTSKTRTKPFLPGADPEY